MPRLRMVIPPGLPHLVVWQEDSLLGGKPLLRTAALARAVLAHPQDRRRTPGRR
ncbi:hypothetical protein [Arthrobacter citreus]|uniref:hypothetical protein n=1 Tax=Arthrobacter citreus TaxID=1670 RepID=UPI0031F8E88E